MKSTALPLLVVLGSLYLWWPSLCVPLFMWVLGLVGVVGVLIGLAMKLHSFEPLATQGELFGAVKARDLARATKLAKLAKDAHEVDAGRQVGPRGIISSRTPLFEAAANGHTEMVAALLEAGADPNACGALGLGTLCSATPLSAAVTQGSAKTVAALLAASANPNTPMSFGMGMFASVTPLYTAGLAASRSGSTEMVAALVKAGADTGARSMAGLGMLLWATPMEFQVVRGEWFEHVTRDTKMSKRLKDLLKRQS